ncbi:MAG: type II secretion system protein [Kiritimatiellae bacterium]|nr:type II secretion system protein [Kiritimatiellia bacterium]
MKTKNGFTLVEMLLVIGIIGVLSSVMVVSFGKMAKHARRSDAQRTVSEVATAFNQLLIKQREWPKTLLDNEDQGMVPQVCYIFQKHKLLDITTYTRDKASGALNSMSDTYLSKTSVDRFGMLDPWGRDSLKKNPSCTSDQTTIIGGKGSYKDHLIQYRLDRNYDGFVDSEDGEMPVSGLRIRGSVIVWSRGEDGKDDGKAHNRYPVDDNISWTLAEIKAK